MHNFLHLVQKYRSYVLVVVGVLVLIGAGAQWHHRIGVTLGNGCFGAWPVYNLACAELGYELAWSETEPQPYIQYALGRIAFIRGDFDEALAHFDQELSRFPFSDQAYYMRGLTYGYMHREQEGIDSFTEFVKRHPDNWPSRNDLAWLYFRMGRLEEAYDTILPAATRYSGTPWVENTYGVILLNRGEKKEARAAFERGLLTLNQMTEEEWGIAYPGNDPRVYGEGLEQMKRSFETNRALTEE